MQSQAKTSITAGQVLMVLICLIASATWLHFRALGTAVLTPTFHMDGAFQTASGLFRLALGQMPGRDFMPYLGMGPLFSLYPLFVLAGAKLAASVYAAHAVCVLAAAAYPILVVRVLLGTSLVNAVLVGLLTIQTLTLLPHPPGWATWALTPGNSLRPLRSILPVIAALGWYEIALRVHKPHLRAALLGAMMGVSLLWSNDFALITAVGLGVGVPLHESRTRGQLTASFLATFLVSGLLTGVSLYAIGTAGHPMELLRYNFRDVAQDQWWYFGSYLPENRVFTPIDALRILARVELDQLGIFLLLMAYWWRNREVSFDPLIWVACVLAGGGVVACVGGHIDNYFGGLQMFLKITGWIVALRAIYGLLPAGLRRPLNLLPLAMAISVAFVAIRAHSVQLASVSADANYKYVPELGGHIRSEWTPYLDFFRAHPDARLFEEYWGIASAMHPDRNFATGAKVDAAIHALGQLRAVTRQSAFGQADFIVTTRPDFSDWQSWSLSQNYWLYGELFAHWSPVLTGTSTVVWQRAAPAAWRPVTPQNCEFKPADRSIRLETETAGAFHVSFDLAVQSPTRRMLVHLRNNFSVGGDTGGLVFIAPQGGHVDTILYKSRTRGEDFPLGWLPSGLPAGLQVSNCQYSQIPALPAQALALPWAPAHPIAAGP